LDINAFETSGRNQTCHLEYGISNSSTPITTGIPSIVYWYATLKRHAMYNVILRALCATIVAVKKQ